MKIDSFKNEYFFLSNFYSAPITYNGISYNNNEAAFQAQKSNNPDDKLLFSSLSPSEAKKLGRNISLRKDWEEIKVSVMEEIIREKFDQNPDLKEKLLDTEDAYLEEGNDWGDKIWGTVNGKGANLLGTILMKIRDEYDLHREISYED